MCVPFLSFLFFRLEDLDRDQWKKINVFNFIFFKYILLEKESPRFTARKKKLKKKKKLTQRRIHFFLGEERDWAAASGGLTFSILSLKGVWGL